MFRMTLRGTGFDEEIVLDCHSFGIIEEHVEIVTVLFVI